MKTINSIYEFRNVFVLSGLSRKMNELDRTFELLSSMSPTFKGNRKKKHRKKCKLIFQFF